MPMNYRVYVKYGLKVGAMSGRLVRVAESASKQCRDYGLGIGFGLRSPTLVVSVVFPLHIPIFDVIL